MGYHWSHPIIQLKVTRRQSERSAPFTYDSHVVSTHVLLLSSFLPPARPAWCRGQTQTRKNISLGVAHTPRRESALPTSRRRRLLAISFFTEGAERRQLGKTLAAYSSIYKSVWHGEAIRGGGGGGRGEVHLIPAKTGRFAHCGVCWQMSP